MDPAHFVFGVRKGTRSVERNALIIIIHIYNHLTLLEQINELLLENESAILEA